MAIDITEPQSPGWWLNRLALKLLDRQPRIQKLMDRFEGNPPLPHGAESAKDAFKAFQKLSRTNYSELIVEAVRERMTPTGFRTAADSDPNGDKIARDVADANGLDIEVADVLQLMLAAGDGYMIVGLDNDTGMPLITGEDPRQVVTIHDPARQRVVRAGLKLFHDPEEQKDLAYLYLPGEVHVASRSIKRLPKNHVVRFSAGAWDWDRAPAPLPAPVVPVVRFRNKRGVGEFEPHVDLLDRINYVLLQRLVIATFQAFRQRAVKGLPDKDEDGTDIDWAGVFTGDPGAFWQVPNEVDFWPGFRSLW